jgi:Outer membrane lipoprotein Slp family
MTIFRIGLMASSLALASAAAAAAPDVLLDVTSASRDNQQGATVLWGGQIVSRSESDGQSCIEVAALPLDRKDGKPNFFGTRRQGPADGPRFIACGKALDPTAFVTGNLATVAGTLGPTQERACKEPGFRGSNPGGVKRQTAHGCMREVPVVAIADSRSWNNLHADGPPSLSQPMWPFDTR